MEHFGPVVFLLTLAWPTHGSETPERLPPGDSPGKGVEFLDDQNIQTLRQMGIKRRLATGWTGNPEDEGELLEQLLPSLSQPDMANPDPFVVPSAKIREVPLPVLLEGLTDEEISSWRFKHSTLWVLLQCLADEKGVVLIASAPSLDDLSRIEIIAGQQVKVYKGPTKLRDGESLYDLDGYGAYIGWDHLEVVELLCGDANNEILLKGEILEILRDPPGPPYLFWPYSGSTWLLMLRPASDLPDNEIGRSNVLFVPYINHNNSTILLGWNVENRGDGRRGPPYPPLAPKHLSELKKLIGIKCK